MNETALKKKQNVKNVPQALYNSFQAARDGNEEDKEEEEEIFIDLEDVGPENEKVQTNNNNNNNSLEIKRGE